MRRVSPRQRTVGLLVVLACASGVAGVASPSGARRTAQARPAAGISGAGTSTLTIQNLDLDQPAEIEALFFKQGGGAPVSIRRGAEPGGVSTIHLLDEPSLSNGAYAAGVSANRPIAAQVRIDWPNTGAAALYNDVPAGTDVLVPLIAKNAGGQTSLISIRNADETTATTVDVQIIGAALPPIATTTVTLQPGSSTTLDMIHFQPFAVIPAGFVGAARVRARTPVAVQVFSDFADSQRGVVAYEGVPQERAASRLFAPLIRSRQLADPRHPDGPRLDTRIAVMNPGVRTAEVEVTYRGTGGSCAGLVQPHAGGRWIIAPGAMAVFDQGPGGAAGLPDDCYGTAELDAGAERIAAVVLDAQVDSGANIELAAAYTAFIADDAARQVLVPDAGRASIATSLGPETTGLQVMNAGDRSAGDVHLMLFDDDGLPVPGCGSDCWASIAAGAAHTWWLGALPAVPDGFHGTAVITGGEALAVIVCHYPKGIQSDMSCAAGMPVTGAPAVKHDLPILLTARNFRPRRSDRSESHRAVGSLSLEVPILVHDCPPPVIAAAMESARPRASDLPLVGLSRMFRAPWLRR